VGSMVILVQAELQEKTEKLDKKENVVYLV
jgi:hypothetical protein